MFAQCSFICFKLLSSCCLFQKPVLNKPRSLTFRWGLKRYSYQKDSRTKMQNIRWLRNLNKKSKLSLKISDSNQVMKPPQRQHKKMLKFLCLHFERTIFQSTGNFPHDFSRTIYFITVPFMKNDLIKRNPKSLGC